MTEQTLNPRFFREGYADVNGVHLYYQIHGEPGQGTPLVMLHGGLLTIDSFGENLAALARGRQVIGVDLEGHGRTALIDRPLSFDSMADDIAALVQCLGLEQVDLLGYSLGGGVSLLAAIRHPEMVRKLVMVSAPVRQTGWHAGMMPQPGEMGVEAADAMKASPLYQTYASVAPRPEDWGLLVTRMGDLLSQPYDHSEAFARLPMPVLIVAGDSDGMPPAQAVEMFTLRGGGLKDAGWDGAGMVSSRLAILPAATHYNSFQSPLLPGIVNSFLEG